MLIIDVDIAVFGWLKRLPVACVAGGFVCPMPKLLPPPLPKSVLGAPAGFGAPPIGLPGDYYFIPPRLNPTPAPPPKTLVFPGY